MGIALSGRYKLYPPKKHLRSYFKLQGTELMPRSHQSLNMFKSCLVKHGLKLFSL